MHLLFRKSLENGTIEMFADADWEMLKARLVVDRFRHDIADVLHNFDHCMGWDHLRNGLMVNDGEGSLWWRWSEPVSREFAPVIKDDVEFGVSLFKGEYVDISEHEDFCDE